jgi:hypothetical protein
VASYTARHHPQRHLKAFAVENEGEAQAKLEPNAVADDEVETLDDVGRQVVNVDDANKPPSSSQAHTSVRNHNHKPFN